MCTKLNTFAFICWWSSHIFVVLRCAHTQSNLGPSALSTFGWCVADEKMLEIVLRRKCIEKNAQMFEALRNRAITKTSTQFCDQRHYIPKIQEIDETRTKNDPNDSNVCVHALHLVCHLATWTKTKLKKFIVWKSHGLEQNSPTAKQSRNSQYNRNTAR